MMHERRWERKVQLVAAARYISSLVQPDIQPRQLVNRNSFIPALDELEHNSNHVPHDTSILVRDKS